MLMVITRKEAEHCILILMKKLLETHQKALAKVFTTN